METREVDMAIARQIEDGYRRIGESIETLTRPETWEMPADDFVRWKLDLLWRLRDFQTLLLKQFDLEEEGGFIQDVVRLAPQYAARVETLQEEHHKVVADLNHVLNVLKDIRAPSPARTRRLRERFTDVITLFERHESAENRLLQDVYFQDYGSGD
ncbi:hypothetical protein GQ464_004105 [Rhodocaloribacter litoris]|uniref:hypothetical protein n=1 Tax=Rhodocaloribacter litoris TaxID=2558931 RepID=UPI00142271FE|nr:hypothetical protein [Rhodocaloribacter litoris]QXD16142.1 hypothetical protein GQ464_004105 [Rhodocaloribacter litoris]